MATHNEVIEAFDICLERSANIIDSILWKRDFHDKIRQTHGSSDVFSQSYLEGLQRQAALLLEIQESAKRCY